LSPQDHPEAGHFYRSDHFSLAKAGVPSVSIGAGLDYVGRPAGWGLQQSDDYTAHRYHQPSDSYRPDFDLSGAVQLSDIVLCFADAGSRVSMTGGPYAYVETAFGPLVGFVAGALLWVGITLALSAVSTFFADSLLALVPALGATGRRVALVVVLALLAAANS